MNKLIPLCLLLGACTTTKQVPVTVEKTHEVKVAVAQPCVSGEKPDEVVPLRDRLAREEWEVLTTDQRENLLGAQALQRKAYGDKLAVATAACH